MFLGAPAAVTGWSGTRDDAASAMQQVSQMVGAHPARLAKRLGIGGGRRQGSLVYALVRTEQLLGDDDLLVDAHKSALITPEAIAGDRGLDVVTGYARRTARLSGFPPDAAGASGRHIAAVSLLLGSRATSGYARVLHHVKVTYAPGAHLDAKAYLGAVHYWLTADRLRPRLAGV